MKVAATQQSSKGRIRALCQGIRAAGDEVVPLEDPSARVAVAANWGDAIEYYHDGRRRVLVCECGYLGNRNMWCSLSWDGLNGRGIHVEGPERPAPELEAWRARSDGYALLLGQVPEDWAVRVALKWPYEEWRAAAAAELERRGFEVRYRPHPEVYMRNMRPTRAQRALREELEGARIAATLNSTAAVEAVCMGVPTVVWDLRGCMAGPVAAEFGRLEEPGNRRAWVNRLARIQWSTDELADGTAWRALRGVL